MIKKKFEFQEVLVEGGPHTYLSIIVLSLPPLDVNESLSLTHLLRMVISCFFSYRPRRPVDDDGSRMLFSSHTSRNLFRDMSQS